MRRTLRDRLQPKTDIALHIIFDGLVVLTHLARGRSDRSRAEMRGSNGAINYDFGGHGQWHVRIQDGLMWMKRGHHAQPMATVRMSPETFFRLLSGDTSYIVAQMTGLVRIEGDGHAGIMVGALIGGLRGAREREDRRGKFTRAWTDLALRASRRSNGFNQAQKGSQS